MNLISYLCWLNFCHQFQENVAPCKLLPDKFKDTRGLVLNAPHISRGGVWIYRDSISVVDLSSTTITYNGRRCGSINIKSR